MNPEFSASQQASYQPKQKPVVNEFDCHDIKESVINNKNKAALFNDKVSCEETSSRDYHSKQLEDVMATNTIRIRKRQENVSVDSIINIIRIEAVRNNGRHDRTWTIPLRR